MPGARSVLAVVFIATLVMSLSSNMLNIAVPALSAHFAASAGETSLVVIAYQLVNTMLLVPMGQVADAINRRAAFLVSLSFFALVSLAMGFSPDILGVTVGRALQGAAAALLLSNAVAILATVFPAERLTGAMGVYLSGFAIGQVLGPVLGGMIVSSVGWRWLFWGLAPLAIVAVLWGLVVFRAIPAAPTRRPRLDLPGGFLLAVALGGTQVALALAAQVGFGDRRVLLALAGCLALAPLIMMVERRVANPVLSGELFRHREFPLALLNGFLVMLPRMGGVTVAGLYFQGIVGDPASIAALKVLGFPVGLTIGSLAGDRFGRRVGHPVALSASAGLATAGMALMALDVVLGTSVLTMLALVLAGLGNGVFQAENSSMITLSTPRERTGVVNSIRVLTQVFGSGVGLALAMALIVAFVPGDVARLFLSGDAAALGDSRSGVELGYLVTYISFTVLMLAGTVLTRRRTGPAAAG